VKQRDGLLPSNDGARCIWRLRRHKEQDLHGWRSGDNRVKVLSALQWRIKQPKPQVQYLGRQVLQSAVYMDCMGD
jgi:hypothetical protein